MTDISTHTSLALHQSTLKQVTSFNGKGLHTGRHVNMKVYPAEANSGIVFQRTDKKGNNVLIPATWRYAMTMPLSSAIQHPDGVHVRTIEHFLAACYACDIDNALIELNGEELPLLDGSAQPFIEGLMQAGIKEQNENRRYIKITKPISIEKDQRHIQLLPADELSADVTLTLPEIGEQRWQGKLTPGIFSKEIASARTYSRVKRAIQGFLLSRLLGIKIGRGATLKNSLVVTKKGVLNKGGLRMPDELVRHRVVDLTGDLMLTGSRIIGHVTGYRLSHDLNQMLVKAIFDHEDAWQWYEVKDISS
ncbi:MAG: UDP-3-O-[3-hydroxymyristoyl] N-acetylglucosamine deacetylase [Gammaproteobacteria bacterium]|nr:MAG: UDP-3-O-[3-hydroxymyristoyl] N-acetylglucosamine deacetylase [Gammaproteobacteria bacterium]